MWYEKITIFKARSGKGVLSDFKKADEDVSQEKVQRISNRVKMR